MTPILSAFTLQAILAYKHFKAVSCLDVMPVLQAQPMASELLAIRPVEPPARATTSVVVQPVACRVEVEQFLDGVDVMDSTWDLWEDTLAEYAIAA
jgi:hypothetical protein